MKRYKINEIFYSLQGEGIRAGTPNVFVRFSGCNLACDLEAGPKSPGGFKCDTEFESGSWFDSDQLIQAIADAAGLCRNVIWTGGEPTLQLDHELIVRLKVEGGFYQAIETNGSREVPDGLDWICVSPKIAEHAIVQREAHEVKYVRALGQAIPKTVVKADYYLISPAFDGSFMTLETKANIGWCTKLVKENPQWRLSCQQHKWWNIR
jgi:7-carboxy-7-deazaguanine synthase